MFSSMTNAMAKCWIPTGTQTYWDKTNWDIRKITLERLLTLSKWEHSHLSRDVLQ